MDAFEGFDADGDGRITRTEFLAAVEKLDPLLPKHHGELIEELLTAIDSDKNGTIDFREFCEELKPEPPPATFSEALDLLSDSFNERAAEQLEALKVRLERVSGQVSAKFLPQQRLFLHIVPAPIRSLSVDGALLSPV